MVAATLKIQSPAFAADADIPRRYTADGENLSPPLEWSGVPQNAKELALVVDDPDAPTGEPFAHWLLFGIPPETTRLSEAAASKDEVPAAQGRNSFDTLGYRGPSPPPGDRPHHYRFNLYALDAPLDLKPGANRNAVLKAIEGHVLARGELVGTYGRT